MAVFADHSQPTGEPLHAFIGLGANLGLREAALRGALAGMAALPGTRLVAVSGLYVSAPVDAGGPDFLNAAAHLHTTLAPHALLAALQALEQQAGRERPYLNAPRTLDLDIVLLHADAHGVPGQALSLDTPQLTVPHPRWTQRAFVLLPMADLAPGWVTPAHRASVAHQRVALQQGPDWAR